ncbi:MAG: carboxypeptidase regulatory-like domain-containing protein [Gemmatimonadales bacterium]
MNRLGFKAVATALIAFVTFAAAAGAQVTTGGIGGTITDESGKPMADVQVRVTNTQTGFKSGSVSRANGRYIVGNLDVGTGYTVEIRRIGFAPITRENVVVTLGENAQQDFMLRAQAAQLGAVSITADPSNVFTPTRNGAESELSANQITHLPNLGRDITGLVKYAPQVNNQTGGGPSAGGQYNRYNNFTIDGANQNDAFGLAGSGGVPGGATNAHIISVDAVKEFQVLMAPADVRQGNFTGMAVNMVTKNGTNTWHGGAGYAYRNPDFAADQAFIKTGDLRVSQFGFYVGGPLIKDKLQIFIAPEFQTKTNPSSGTYIGAPLTDPGLISADSINRIVNDFKAKGIDIGGGQQVKIQNPLTNLMGRVDWEINDNNRFVFRTLYNTAKNTSFSRSNSSFNTSPTVQSTGFRLTSNGYTAQNTNASQTASLYTQLSGGKTNELFTGYNTIDDIRILGSGQQLPEMSLAVTPQSGGTPIAVTFGSEQFSAGNALNQKVFEIADNYTIPMGNHTFLLGARYERTSIYDNFPQQADGVYKFANIAGLEANTPIAYAVGYANGGVGYAKFNVQQSSLYAQDQWDLSGTFRLTYGLRLDMPQMLDKPVRNDSVVAQYVKAGLPPVYTDATPKAQVLFSPRVGFNWDVTGDRKNQVRGTFGLFTATPPWILLGNAYQGTGLGYVTLACTGAANAPAFTTDVNNLPKSCAGQAAPTPGFAGTSVLNANDPNFKYPQSWVASVGFDRQLPWGTVFTFDGLYRHAYNGIMVIDKNLKGPRLVNGVPYTDVNGRVLYADTITATGAVTNAGQKVINSLGGPPVAFSQGTYYVTNENTDYNYTLTGQLKKKFSDQLEMNISYTRMKSMDVQSLTSDRAVSNFQNGRNYDGLQTDMTPTTSAFERPNRIMFFGTWTLPWKTTDFSWYYEAMSGYPIVYTIASADLNGDGINTNDAIYVPTSTTDPKGWQFKDIGSGASLVTAASQNTAFNNFISANACLNKQRGHIMSRDSCNAPWQDRADVSIVQRFPSFMAGQRLSAQLDIFNVANLINKSWGQVPQATLSTFPQQAILLSQGRTAGPLNTSVPIVQFSQSIMNNIQPTATYNGSFFRSQTSTANFYSMQLSLKYTF